MLLKSAICSLTSLIILFGGTWIISLKVYFLNYVVKCIENNEDGLNLKYLKTFVKTNMERVILHKSYSFRNKNFAKKISFNLICFKVVNILQLCTNMALNTRKWLSFTVKVFQSVNYFSKFIKSIILLSRTRHSLHVKILRDDIVFKQVFDSSALGMNRKKL